LEKEGSGENGKHMKKATINNLERKIKKGFVTDLTNEEMELLFEYYPDSTRISFIDGRFKILISKTYQEIDLNAVRDMRIMNILK
jgi:hypothetical protein